MFTLREMPHPISFLILKDFGFQMRCHLFLDFLGKVVKTVKMFSWKQGVWHNLFISVHDFIPPSQFSLYQIGFYIRIVKSYLFLCFGNSFCTMQVQYVLLRISKQTFFACPTVSFMCVLFQATFVSVSSYLLSCYTASFHTYIFFFAA